MRKIRYDDGGSLEDQQERLNQAMGIGAQGIAMAGQFADALDPMNEYGRQSTGTNILKSVGSMASTGAALGPIGAGVGAGLGLVGGLVTSASQKRQELRLKRAEDAQKLSAAMSRYSARAAADPSVAEGVKGEQYFRNGGQLKSLSSNSVEVVGPSHENGGVKLSTGEEVEGKETISGNYVFSDELGFAKLHKPLAKAIGVLESKPKTRSTVNSLTRLREKEEALKLFQEMYRKKHNLV